MSNVFSVPQYPQKSVMGAKKESPDRKLQTVIISTGSLPCVKVEQELSKYHLNGADM